MLAQPLLHEEPLFNVQRGYESFTETRNSETKINFDLLAARTRVYIDKDKDIEKELLLKSAQHEIAGRCPQ